jgi:hypothetical protein
MTDKPSDKPIIPSEVVPSKTDHVSGIGSAVAPFVYTDWIGSHGHNAGVAQFTLEALRNMTVGDELVRDRVVVAHLRMPIHTMRALKNSIEKVEAMLKPPAGQKVN